MEMRKRDWLLAAALVPFALVWFPFALLATVLIMGWGLLRPRPVKPHNISANVRERSRFFANPPLSHVLDNENRYQQLCVTDLRSE